MITIRRQAALILLVTSAALLISIALNIVVTESPLKEVATLRDDPVAKSTQVDTRLLGRGVDHFNPLSHSSPPVTPSADWQPPKSSQANYLAVDTEAVVNIGEYIDPDDPYAVSALTSIAPVNFGDYIDPEDPSFLDVYGPADVVNIGEFIDLDAYNAWSNSQGAGVANFGEYIDPESYLQETIQVESGFVNFGEYMEPEVLLN